MHISTTNKQTEKKKEGKKQKEKGEEVGSRRNKTRVKEGKPLTRKFGESEQDSVRGGGGKTEIFKQGNGGRGHRFTEMPGGVQGKKKGSI